MAIGIVCEAVSDGNRVCRLCAAPLPPWGGIGRPAKRCSNCAAPKGPRWPNGPSKPANKAYSGTCVICSASFDAESKSTRTCGVSCGQTLARRSRVARCAIEKSRICEQCNTPFREGVLSQKQRDAGHRQRFCSKRCMGASKRVYQTRTEAKRAGVSRRRERDGAPPPRLLSRSVCQCGSPFRTLDPAIVACVKCRTKVPRLTRPCADCGADVIGTASKRICRSCSRKRNPSNARLRARKCGVAYEPINPIRIFERDGWKCHMCGKKTPRKKRGTIATNAPELDHITALALGGSHTKANVATACRACNSRKGAGSFGQPSLLAYL